MAKNWKEWEIEEAKNLEKIKDLQKEGHTFHCANRQVFGDGECECNRKNFIPGSISRSMYIGACPICLQVKGHKDWCKNAKRWMGSN